MNKMPRIYDLVVMHHNAGATLYRVIDILGHDVGVVDATIEAANQRLKWVDLSDLQQPNHAQLAQLKGS